MRLSLEVRAAATTGAGILSIPSRQGSVRAMITHGAALFHSGQVFSRQFSVFSQKKIFQCLKCVAVGGLPG
jgi:hypothetical protein